MADFRTVKTSMWAQDEWFMDLPIDGKLLWIYVFTNSHTSVAGIYKLPMRTIVFETGRERGRIQELLKLFEQEQKAFFEDGVIWVSKMRDHQATSSDQVRLGNNDIQTLFCMGAYNSTTDTEAPNLYVSPSGQIMRVVAPAESSFVTRVTVSLDLPVMESGISFPRPLDSFARPSSVPPRPGRNSLDPGTAE